MRTDRGHLRCPEAPLCLQVDFLFDVYEDLLGTEPSSFLELACGPAQHSLEMAESQLDVFCLDSNARMLEYAQGLAAADNLKFTALHEDMRAFAMPVRARLPLGCSIASPLQPCCVQVLFRSGCVTALGMRTQEQWRCNPFASATIVFAKCKQRGLRAGRRARRYGGVPAWRPAAHAH
jgi:SAM-dependent methyltransferase